MLLKGHHRFDGTHEFPFWLGIEMKRTHRKRWRRSRSETHFVTAPSNLVFCIITIICSYTR